MGWVVSGVGTIPCGSLVEFGWVGSQIHSHYEMGLDDLTPPVSTGLRWCGPMDQTNLMMLISMSFSLHFLFRV